MKASTNFYVVLELTVEEARWLHGLMQNPLPLSWDCDPQKEDPHDRKMRKAFYEATSLEDQDG